MECDRQLACRFAGHFLSIEPPASVNDVVRDVLGELANMIGGNLKSIWPEGMRISMPLVVDGSDYRFRVCGAQMRERMALRTDEGTFWISVLTVPI
jgi:chemotaxis protein CheX